MFQVTNDYLCHQEIYVTDHKKSVHSTYRCYRPVCSSTVPKIGLAFTDIRTLNTTTGTSQPCISISLAVRMIAVWPVPLFPVPSKSFLGSRAIWNGHTLHPRKESLWESKRAINFVVLGSSAAIFTRSLHASSENRTVCLPASWITIENWVYNDY